MENDTKPVAKEDIKPEILKENGRVFEKYDLGPEQEVLDGYDKDIQEQLDLQAAWQKRADDAGVKAIELQAKKAEIISK